MNTALTMIVMSTVALAVAVDAVIVGAWVWRTTTRR
jgi:hypothetical protein